VKRPEIKIYKEIDSDTSFFTFKRKLFFVLAVLITFYFYNHYKKEINEKIIEIAPSIANFKVPWKR
jgi:hypothetical protein